MHATLSEVLTAQWGSIQDALRAFLPPIKNEDACLDFYTVYKKEAAEYDTYYVKRYDEDLNTTLIFVRCLPLAVTTRLAYSRRRVCFLPSAQRLLSMFNRTSSLIRPNSRQSSFVPSSSPSTSPLSQAKSPSFHPSKRIPLAEPLSPPVSCIPV